MRLTCGEDNGVRCAGRTPQSTARIARTVGILAICRDFVRAVLLCSSPSASERLGGQRQREAGSTAGFARTRVASRELTALGAGKIASDGETQARAPALSRPSGLSAVEAVEDARQLLGRNARSRVRYGRLGTSFSGTPLHGDEPSRGREPEGVVE